MVCYLQVVGVVVLLRRRRVMHLLLHLSLVVEVCHVVPVLVLVTTHQRAQHLKVREKYTLILY